MTPWVLVSSQAAAVSPTPTAATITQATTRAMRTTTRLGIESTISIETWASRVTRTPATTKVSQTSEKRASSPVQDQPSIGR